MQIGQNRIKILHSCQEDIPKWLIKIKVINSFFNTEFLKVYKKHLYNFTSRLCNNSISCLHNKFWLLAISNDTERKNVFNKFNANKINFIQYDQILFVPLHINNNR